VAPESGPVGPEGEAARRLHDLLVAPLLAGPAPAVGPGVKTLLVSPDPDLARIPFGLVAAGERPLDVACVPSGTTYLLLRNETGAARGQAVLAVGDPDYARGGAGPSAGPGPLALRGGTALGRLPASRDEVEAIASRPMDVRLLWGDATEDGLERAIAQRPGERWRAVHLAGHGLIDLEQPRFSSVALTPSATEDGFLYAEEVLQWQVKADLAVLSACRTGQGKVVRGEGILGLTRAFMHGGVPRVLVSLWDVDDAATKELMVAFYERWRADVPAARALREAQGIVRTWKASHPQGPDWSDPRYWAAWVLWGLP
jgi:CHAT domain-containing protein